MDKKNILGLGLESSCDETAASVVCNGSEMHSNIIKSQIDLHSKYYGVVPEIASRAHLEAINDLIEISLAKAGIGFSDLDYVAATSRPGLVGSLLIALQSAKAISYALKIPLIAINHIEAHLYAPFLEANKADYPYIGLLVSGGNSAIYRINGVGNIVLIGKTSDDAAGEAIDKIAKFLDIGYPGGPAVEKLAKESKSRPRLFTKILSGSNDYRFSFSGIKTAVVNYAKQNPDALKCDIVYSFQEITMEVLVRKVFMAAREFGIKNIIVAGGVAANSRLREMLNDAKRDENIIIPSPVLCTDNAAMVAGLGYHYFMRCEFSDLSVDVAPKVNDKRI